MDYLVDCGKLRRVSARSASEALRLAEAGVHAGESSIVARRFCRCGAPIYLEVEAICNRCGELHCAGCGCEDAIDA